MLYTFAKLICNYYIYLPAAEVIIYNLNLASSTATTLSVTWSAGYPRCYSFAVSHSTQDASINVTQPADSDTSHTLTSLQPGTTYRIEVEAVRKGERADGQRAKVMGYFTTDKGIKGEVYYVSCSWIYLCNFCCVIINNAQFMCHLYSSNAPANSKYHYIWN